LAIWARLTQISRQPAEAALACFTILARRAQQPEWRALFRTLLARMEINGPLYYSASTVLAAIDGMTLLLTGSRDHFHLKGHGRGEDRG